MGDLSRVKAVKVKRSMVPLIFGELLILLNMLDYYYQLNKALFQIAAILINGLKVVEIILLALVYGNPALQIPKEVILEIN